MVVGVDPAGEVEGEERGEGAKGGGGGADFREGDGGGGGEGVVEFGGFRVETFEKDNRFAGGEDAVGNVLDEGGRGGAVERVRRVPKRAGVDFFVGFGARDEEVGSGWEDAELHPLPDWSEVRPETLEEYLRREME